jgi:multiple sugar transport system substrate-binding protein
MSGGWTWAIPAKSPRADAAFKLIQTLQNPSNATKYTVVNGQIAVRKDVAEDPEYKKMTDKLRPLSEAVAVTHYRPAFGAYPRISNEIQVAAEAVMTGQSPDKAAKAYDEAVKRLVGDEKTTTK